MSKSGFLEKQRALQQGFLDTGEEMGMQKMWDYVQLALRDPEVMGKDTLGKERLTRLFNRLKELADTYHTCFTDDKEADVYQEKLDANLREIWDEELTPFYERYPQLKKVGYNKARKGWK